MAGRVMRIRLGTRGSRLALVQSGAMAVALEEMGAEVELVEIKTTGDRITDVPLGPSVGQAFFTKELEDALLEGRIDLAVHSCKDLATRLPEGLVLGAIPPREDPRDALVSRDGLRLSELPAGATVGTASVRRQRFLAEARPDLTVQNLRGNVPTRLAAVEEGRFDAVVLAAAGLRRLGRGDAITEFLSTEVMLPAAAQGALALQIRAADAELAELVGRLDDEGTRAEVTAERACLRRLEAGCQAPVGALATRRDGRLHLEAAVALDEKVVRARLDRPLDEAAALGAAGAEALLAELGLSTLAHAPWAGPSPRRLDAPGGARP